jgi:hypothetical protein
VNLGTGSAEVQPAKHSLMDGNNKAAEKTSTALLPIIFIAYLKTPTCHIK